jgi:hypothetical protein
MVLKSLLQKSRFFSKTNFSQKIAEKIWRFFGKKSGDFLGKNRDFRKKSRYLGKNRSKKSWVDAKKSPV